MPNYIALLRGINVSGKNKLPMAALKSLCEDLGYTQVTTYIQSGNVILQADDTLEEIAKKLSQAIQTQFGYTVPVLVREVAFFRQLIAKNPFQDYDSKTLHVTLLDGKGHGAKLAGLPSTIGEEDRFVVQNDVVYVHCPNGYGRTILNNNFFEAKASTSATTRNWRTVCKLVELTAT